MCVICILRLSLEYWSDNSKAKANSVTKWYIITRILYGL